MNLFFNTAQETHSAESNINNLLIKFVLGSLLIRINVKEFNDDPMMNYQITIYFTSELNIWKKETLLDFLLLCY